MTKEQIRENIGRIVQSSRESKGWSRYQLAHKAGVQETHLAKIEQGDYSIRVDILQRICEALEIEITFPIEA